MRKFFSVSAVFASIAVLLVLISQWRPYFFAQEIVISFLPYVLFTLSVWLVINSCYFLGRVLHRLNIVDPLMLLTQVVSAAALIVSFMSTGYFAPLPVTAAPNYSYKVAFHNKYFFNADYETLSESYQDLGELDFLLLAEFGKQDAANITALDAFPYQYGSRSTSFLDETELALYSRHEPEFVRTDPLKTLPSLHARFRDPAGQPFDIVVIHTAAPVSQNLWQTRNRQLESLQAYLTSGVMAERYLIAGDFNLTPWSGSFQSFLAATDLRVARPTTGWPLTGTWELTPRLPITAHIDHFFYNGIALQNYSVGATAHSDHNIIRTEILLPAVD